MESSSVLGAVITAGYATSGRSAAQGRKAFARGVHSFKQRANYAASSRMHSDAPQP
jgi:hypothetical protein